MIRWTGTRPEPEPPNVLARLDIRPVPPVPAGRLPLVEEDARKLLTAVALYGEAERAAGELEDPGDVEEAERRWLEVVRLVSGDYADAIRRSR